ncbi:hypothetical protein CBL_11271 [Carabus blaptoides fortunei]
MNKARKVGPANVQQMFAKQYNDNCLACILRPSLIMGSFIGLAPITSHCPHTNTHLNKCVFERSYWLSVFPVLHMLYILYILYNNVSHILYTADMQKLQLIYEMTSTALEISTLAVVLCTGIIALPRIKELTSLAAIISNSRRYNVAEMFSATVLKTLKRYILISATAIVSMTTLYLVYCLRSYPVFYSIKICLSLFTQLTFALQLIINTHVYILLVEKCFGQIELCLEQRLNDLTKRPKLFVMNMQRQVQQEEIRTKEQIKGAGGSILHRLQKLQRLHCAVYNNVELMNATLNPILLLCIAGVTIILVMNDYLVLNFWLSGGNVENSIQYILLFVRSFSVLGVLLYIPFKFSSLQNTKNDILRYLEGYPIIELPSLEAMQVEMLITTIRVLDLKISASHMFDVNIKLITSVTSVILSNKLKNSLLFTSVHPIPEFRDEENGTRIFLLVYRICTSKHLKTMHKTEIIAYLQELYREILKNLDSMNDVFNPQNVLHMSCEIFVTVLDFYAVIIYMTFDEISPSDKTNNIFNSFFILIRLCSMYTFLNTAQQVENLVKKLAKFLIEYSTQISTAEEHQQVRIFIQQLTHHRGVTANGMFTVNLQVAASICANILINKLKNSLLFTSVHPIPEYRDEENGTRIFLLVYRICTSKHLKTMNKTEIIAYLQQLYREIRKNLDSMNDVFNPQIVLHMSCELLVIVLHFYAVIIYMTFDEISPSDKTNNIFNWFFIIIRLCSMYTFLNTAQQIENLVKTLTTFLIEYSTRIYTAEEHQQVRIFIQQLNHHRGITASGIFTVNLQVAAPICANILMYVLESEILTFLESFPISKLQSVESLQVEILIMSVRMLRPQVSASGVFNISITLIASITGTIYFIQFSIIFLFGFLETFSADWSYGRFIMPIIHNTSFLFYSVFGSFCVLSDSMLHCFENKICSVLNFTSVHPIPNFGSKKIRSTLWWKNVICKEKHDKCPPNLNAVQRLEYLQSLYTELQDNLEALNQAFNPQILLHISNEVIVMVFQWYAVIVYFTYDKVTSSDNTNNFFHWYYIIIHSWAMCVALYLAQRVETKIERYKIILLEHSTTVSSAEEHQQLRIFVQTLQSFRGFTANGIFNVNLQIGAPICANILMYVLVAIQFKFPQKDVSKI